MLYSCTYIATVGVKGLTMICDAGVVPECSCQVPTHHHQEQRQPGLPFCYYSSHPSSSSSSSSSGCRSSCSSRDADECWWHQQCITSLRGITTRSTDEHYQQQQQQQQCHHQRRLWTRLVAVSTVLRSSTRWHPLLPVIYSLTFNSFDLMSIDRKFGASWTLAEGDGRYHDWQWRLNPAGTWVHAPFTYQKQDIKALEKVQMRATRLVTALRDKPYQERLRTLALPTLKFRKLRGDMTETYKVLSGIYDAVSHQKCL